MSPGPLRVTLALGLLLLGCSPAAEPTDPLAARRPGLVRLGQVMHPVTGPHLTEAAIVGDYVFVANSNEAFAVYRIVEGEGGLELVAQDPGDPVVDRCTTITVHPATDSLYCGNDDFPGVVRYDIRDPAAPVRAADEFNPPVEGLHVADMVTTEDRLILARYEQGLASATIADDGSLSTLVEQPELGDVRRLDVDAEGRVWALTGDRGLLVLAAEPDGTWTERWQLALDGPPLGLGLDFEGSRAAVGLGSAGLAIVELDASEGGAGLQRTHLLHPPGVVAAADVLGDAAVAVTLLGSFAYDLRAPAAWPEDPRGERAPEQLDEGGARLAGFVAAGPWDLPGSGALVHGTLLERDDQLELIAVDWIWVERLALDLDGFPAGVDLRHGEWLAAEDETVEIAVRNPTPFTLALEHQLVGASAWTRVELPARELTIVQFPSAELEIDTPQLIVVRVLDGDEVVTTTGVTVLRRPPLADSPITSIGRPPPGAAFPELTLTTGWPGAIESLVVPTPGVAQRVVFYGIDCAAMWPEVEDILWRVRSGLVSRDAIVLVSHIDPTKTGAWDRWGLDDATWGYFVGPFVPPEFTAQNPFENLYEDGFVIDELPSAAHHPTDYVYDANGVVRLVEREYRGEHPLTTEP